MIIRIDFKIDRKIFELYSALKDDNLLLFIGHSPIPLPPPRMRPNAPFVSLPLFYLILAVCQIT